MDKIPTEDMAVSYAPLRKQMEEKLRQAIVRGHFPPGMHLSDKLLCETFRVSRPVVREAVRQLAAEGLIDTVPHRGSFVKAMSADEAAQFYAVRGVLEALAASNFAKYASDEEVEKLAAVVEEIRAMHAGSDVLDLKQKLYDILFEGSRNSHLTKMLNQILNHNMLLRATSLSMPGRLPKTIAELDRLIDAVRCRNPEAAWQASIDHVNSAAEAAISILKEREKNPAPAE